ncbi:hypothetical protein ATANTOWER_017604 [Ataeniobius toweri]|uniref:Uncharacterized protein n=1 Tax=Ataeniobius toweri TaxID=208326 RepID=A0ABU7BX13_9TELE|nr:hypothetical protein [Ataeniobius toweri]
MKRNHIHPGVVEVTPPASVRFVLLDPEGYIMSGYLIRPGLQAEYVGPHPETLCCLFLGLPLHIQVFVQSPQEIML